MSLIKNKDKLSCLLFFAIVFFCLFIFFTQINPIVVLDIDDWLYMSSTRAAVPLVGAWNPGKVFPEVFMSFCTNIGVFVVHPIIDDYILSVSIAYGFVLTIFVVAYLYRFFRLILSKFHLTYLTALALTTLFLLLHFWAFRGAQKNNTYFFFASNATCYFNYVIPNLLNAGLAMFFLEKEYYSFRDYPSKTQLAFVIFSLYFAVFSNLFPTIILISLFGLVILKHFIDHLKTKTILSNLKRIQIPILGMLFWLICLLFEAGGKRASTAYSKEDSFNILGTAKGFFAAVINDANRPFLFFALFTVICAVPLFLIKRKDGFWRKNRDFLLSILFCLIITAIYIILLSAKVHSEYIKRSDVLFCSFFYGFLLLTVLFCGFVKKPMVKLLMPLLLVIICSLTFVGTDAFAQSNMIGVEAERCRQIDNYLIDTLKKADSDGLTEIELPVPVFDSEDNWPLADTCGDRISYTLYQHHIIHRQIKVNSCPDERVNLQFGLEIPAK